MLSSAELALNNKDYLLFFSFVFGLINSTRSFSFYSPAMAKITIFLCVKMQKAHVCTTTFLSQLFMNTFCCSVFVNDFAFAYQKCIVNFKTWKFCPYCTSVKNIFALIGRMNGGSHAKNKLRNLVTYDYFYSNRFYF